MGREFGVLHDEALAQLQLERSAQHIAAADGGLHVGQQIVTQQLGRGDSDAGEDRRLNLKRFLPSREFARRLLHGENAEVDDQPAFLGQRMKSAAPSGPRRG